MLLNKERITQQLIKVLKASKTEAESIVKGKNDLELIRLISPIDLLDYVETQLNKDEKIIKTLFFIVVLESIVAVKKTNTEKVRLIAEALKNYLNSEEKESLLGSFIFTPPYKFRKTKEHARHLMFHDYNNDEEYKSRNIISYTSVTFNSKNGKNKAEIENIHPVPCSTGIPYICYCVDWLMQTKNYDLYLDELARNLSSMRSAIIHEGSLIFWFPDYDFDKTETFSATLADAFPTNSNLDEFRSYESGMRSEDFLRIIKSCLKGYLLNLPVVN